MNVITRYSSVYAILKFHLSGRNVIRSGKTVISAKTDHPNTGAHWVLELSLVSVSDD